MLGHLVAARVTLLKLLLQRSVFLEDLLQHEPALGATVWHTNGARFRQNWV